MSDLENERGTFGFAEKLEEAYSRGDLLTREEAANAMMAFLYQHGGDVGQHWPTIEDALAWLGADDE